MAEEPIHIVPHGTASRVYASLSGYLQSISHHGPVLAPGSLPKKTAQKPAKPTVKEEKAEKAETTWIAVVLADELGEPVAGERYILELPDGRKREGALDHQGQIKIGNLPNGKCKVSFPDLDESAFADPPQPKSGSSVLPEDVEVKWIVVELLDEQGYAVAGERYVLELSDGSKKVGRLDRNGKLKVRDLPAGKCKLSFPDLDESAFADPPQPKPGSSAALPEGEASSPRPTNRRSA
jgi:hypothetical protein